MVNIAKSAGLESSVFVHSELLYKDGGTLLLHEC